MAVSLIVDAGCDLMVSEARDMGITLVPMTIHFGDHSYRAGFDISHDAFYKKLVDSTELPTTSQPTPYDFACAYAQIPQGGEAVVICVSSALSGTYQSACIAAQEYDNVHIVDSYSATIGQRLLLNYADILRRNGCSAVQIVSKLEDAKRKLVLYGAVDTLEYLIKGGRLSKAAGIVGTVLGVRPILTIHDGILDVHAKARGSKQAIKMIADAVSATDIDTTMPTIMGYTGADPAIVTPYLDASSDVWNGFVPETVQIGSTIGTHAGPGLVGVAFFKKN